MSRFTVRTQDGYEISCEDSFALAEILRTVRTAEPKRPSLMIAAKTPRTRRNKKLPPIAADEAPEGAHAKTPKPTLADGLRHDNYRRFLAEIENTKTEELISILSRRKKPMSVSSIATALDVSAHSAAIIIGKLGNIADTASVNLDEVVVVVTAVHKDTGKAEKLVYLAPKFREFYLALHKKER
jgi:predicted Zn-ribbon and HTH transcriptional regulator